MAVSSTKKEKKAANSAMPLDAEYAVSNGTVVNDTKKASQKTDTFKEDIIEAFKTEFKGMPYTELNVIVQCGHPSAPTYQEIELPVVAKLLEKFRG